MTHPALEDAWTLTPVERRRREELRQLVERGRREEGAPLVGVAGVRQARQLEALGLGYVQHGLGIPARFFTTTERTS